MNAQTNPQSLLMLVFGGIFATLFIASTIAFSLRNVAKINAETRRNLTTRINAWWIMILLLAAALFIGKWCALVLFFLVSLQSLREFVVLLSKKEGDDRVLLWVFYLLLPLQYYFIAINWYGMFSIFIPVFGFLLLPIRAAFGGEPAHFLERSAKILWGLMICVYCLSHIPALFSLQIAGFENQQVLLIVFLILVVQSSDILQYIWGKLFGRHHFSPHISPSKTTEGLIGGVLSSSLVGASLWWMTPFLAWQAAAIALLINTMGFFGGFVRLSAITPLKIGAR